MPAEYESLKPTLDALNDNKNLFTLELFNSRLLQEEQKGKKFDLEILRKPPWSQLHAIINLIARPYFCAHCKRQDHRESTSWDKYPSLQPNHSTASSVRHIQKLDFGADAKPENLNLQKDYACLLAQKSGTSVNCLNVH